MILGGFDAGHTVKVSKVIVIRDVIPFASTYMIKGDDKKSYGMDEWDFEHVEPYEWPPRAGDIWEAAGVRYAAAERDGVTVLFPVSKVNGTTVYPDQFQSVLDQHPVLVLR